MLDVVSLYRDRDASELDGKKLSRTRLVYYDNLLLLLLLIIRCALCTAPNTRREELAGVGRGVVRWSGNREGTIAGTEIYVFIMIINN